MVRRLLLVALVAVAFFGVGSMDREKRGRGR